MKLLIKAYHSFLFLTITITVTASLPKIAKTGCNDTCGNMKIPYPFGIGADCSLNKWYIINCNSSTPRLAAVNNLEVSSINLQRQTLTVSAPKVTSCLNSVPGSNNIFGVDFGRSPFFFERICNKFVFEGCGNAVVMNKGRKLTECLSTCSNTKTANAKSLINISSHTEFNCSGINCCQTAILQYFNSYSIKLESSEKDCGSAFLVDATIYDPFSFRNASFIPIVLLWTLTDSDQVTCCDKSIKNSSQMDLFNGTRLDVRSCDYSSMSKEENPYLIDGCKKDVDDECRRCQDGGGQCGHNGRFTCTYHNRKRIPRCLFLGLIITTPLSLIPIIYLLCKCIKKSKETRRINRFYKRNGGLLLKQQQEANPSLVDKTIHFTLCELHKATNNFNEDRILGRGGQGTVYKGMLVDGRIVAVKKSKLVDENQLEQFINEVVVLSQINHMNVVKLLGCCLESEVPILVYEFIPNGTLYDRLHNETNESPIPFNMRLKIATEVAGALSYLHSSTSIPIYHRDIKTTNILLDDKYRAKVSDFGTSRFVPIEKTHLSTSVQGTFGYLDPEYFQSSQFTEKSDVYSFGVVLVELLTGEKAISLTRFGENRSLATYFTLAMEEGHFMSIFDATVIKEGMKDELLILANLAMRCLNLNGKYRPTMKEVAMMLEAIPTLRIPSTIQTNISGCAGTIILASSESSSALSSCNN